ncbi:MAG TPA: serine/threonine-protein kinase [Gemmataceae bacterium]|nr:serine/threonine-protein kinase [Gemmataceae bacterium]
MLSETENRAAKLAVSRYGADRVRVDQAVQAVTRARGAGQAADLLEALVRGGQLTSAQAQELRLALDSTQLDPTAQANGHANGRGREKSQEPRDGANRTPNLDDSQELRYLGEYRILRRLGEGGMGAVYLGYQETEDHKVAIKVLSDHLAGNQSSVDRFYREAKSGALLNHPNIVRNVAVGQDRTTGKHYLVLEYIDGPSAHTLLARHGRLSVADAVHITLDVARALEHAHSRNVVHRDIKPDNILVTTTGIAKLADLGLAKRTDEASHLTATRQGFGTPYYMPYEQAMNAKYADGRSDIYALGATLYHLVAGQVPFPGINHLEILDKKNLGFFAPASSVNPEVPRTLDQILERMLARDPQDRYQTASELIVELERAGLAAPVPSFVDAEVALQDPLVRERLAMAAQPTAMDVRGQDVTAPSGRALGDPDIWYLRYRDRHGQSCKARATTQQIVRRLRDGKLPREAEAAHEPHGEFLPLSRYREFHEVLSARSRSAKSAPRNGRAGRERPGQPTVSGEGPKSALALPSRWWLLVGLGLGLATLGGLILARVL